MVFSSYIFIFAFLPIVLTGYFMLSKLKNIKVQHIFLLVSSLVFYSWFNTSYLLIIIGSILTNYLISKLMIKYSSNFKLKKNIFIVGIIFNVMLIGYFKYYDFFIDNINALFRLSFSTKNILLPLGISFFTFQQISFLVSIYKGEEKCTSFINYSLFVSFFPQLVAGPIVLYSEMMPQFEDEEKRYINWYNIAQGLYIFVIGLFKKIVIADTLSVWVDNGYSNIVELDFFVSWAIALSYTLQIYFDFSGYSDMAIGLAKTLNIELPVNFNSPYKSQNINEFWRRWHITLGRALSTYIYIPLGGNRKGKLRTYINLMVTFLISGFWHGASWLFILWGGLHGLACCIQRIFKNTGIILNKYISTFITFIFINFTWVLFRSTSLTQAMAFFKAMVIPKYIDIFNIGYLSYDRVMYLNPMMTAPIIIITLIVLTIIIFKSDNSIKLKNKFKPNKKNTVYISILLFISIICLSRPTVFIYFNF